MVLASRLLLITGREKYGEHVNLSAPAPALAVVSEKGKARKLDRKVQAFSDRKMEGQPLAGATRLCPHLDRQLIHPKKTKALPRLSDWTALFRALSALFIACITLHAMAP